MYNWLLVLGPDMPLHLCGLRKGYTLKMLMESWAHGSQFLQPDVDRHKSIAFLLLEKYIVYIYIGKHTTLLRLGVTSLLIGAQVECRFGN